MDFALSPEEQAFKEEVYQFLKEKATFQVREDYDSPEGWGPNLREFVRKLGERGWLAINWPREYGGQSRPFTFSFILREALGYFGVAIRLVGVGMAGPTILLFGTEEQKKEYLPRIARGEIEFALGYTEPQAGSDLAALQIRAEDKGDYYLLNGQKMFNTGCHYAEYHWLGARTDPYAKPKHRGISLFIVDLKSPGITIHPIWCMDGHRTNEVFYDNVKVPKENLVGEKDRGFYHILTAVDFERVYDTGEMQRIFEELVTYARESGLSKHPLVRNKLAQRAVELEAGKLICWNVAWKINKGIIPSYEAAMSKLFVSELRLHLAQTGMEMLGHYALLANDPKWGRLEGRLPRLYLNAPIRCITAGTSEIQRNVIAIRGLGLPR